MATTERLCPSCGAANALERVTCQRCGAELRSGLPVPLGERLPVPWKEARRGLVLGATALALRTGLHLASRLLERRAAEGVGTSDRVLPVVKVRRWLSRRRETERAPRPQPKVRIWGRRAWVSWRGDRTGQWEVEEFYGEAVSDNE